MTDPGAASSLLAWGAAGSALDGFASGDLHVVAPFPGGVLVAVIDGLGHGPEAAEAARAAAALLEASCGASVVELVERCHDGLRRTRGVVMSLASFSARNAMLTWIGIGNVDGVLLPGGSRDDRRAEAILTRGGVVGYNLPPLRPSSLPVARGDLLIMGTDGIRSGFTTDLIVVDDPQELADSILAHHGKGTDDALVLVARYLGAGP